MNNFSSSLKQFFNWDRGTLILLGAFFCTFMAFNVMWCSWTTFTPFSHFPLYISTILMTLLLTLPYVIKRCKWLEILLLILLDFLLLANLMYARTYFNVIPLSSYTNAGNLQDFMPSVWTSLRWADLIFPLITCAAILLLTRNNSAIVRQPKTPLIPYLITLAIPLLCVLICVPTPAKYKEEYRKYYNNAYAYQSTPVMYSVFGSLLYDALVKYETLTPAEQKETDDFIASLPGIEKLPEGVTPPENLVVIFCESLESWVIGLDYDGQQVTPNINKWLTDSTTYYNPHVLSQAKDGRSIDGQLLLLTGLMPLRQGTYSTQFPDDYFPSIQKALKQAHGSRATLMTGDKEYVWNQGRIARSMGTDSIISFPDFRIEDAFTGRKHIGDRALMRQSVEKLKRGDIWPENTPAYLQLVTYSGHGPFRLPDSEKKLRIQPGTPQIMADYMQVAHYTDQALALMIDYLRSRPDWHKTMVVITGDHEGLAAWRAECLASEPGRRYVNPEQFVPLLILTSPLPGHSETVMGQADIYPTLLHLLGLRDYEWPGVGHSILSPTHPGAAINPQGKIVTTPGKKLPTATEQTLQKQRETSDRILSYNLLRPKQ